ncbi:AbrB/MazE/SpoVT family DNA-binding domain-containing protein [Vulcanisaeta sp. JCM 16159]|uniref:AbrB/MazE/SpoVT family DNA-binding domain-containing protein n=1 Tax=Vulcanisaeta sp. JCM 16159 TaxID=1295371 RepID=UPI0006CFA57F|nr:AbrB/MazE/SpoVT family DNA-binding domain-containing protein [Vulcanisaeta sp. JCM 16159]
MVETIVKVTRNYQVTIPASIRERLGIRVGDLVKVVYDEGEGVIKLIPVRRSRTTIRLGRPITVEEIERAIEEVMD